MSAVLAVYGSESGRGREGKAGLGTTGVLLLVCFIGGVFSDSFIRGNDEAENIWAGYFRTVYKFPCSSLNRVWRE